MDASNTNRVATESVIRVRDPKGLLWTIVGVIALTALSLFWNIHIAENLSLGNIPFYIVLNLPLLIILYRLKAIWKGIELDIDNRTMSFQGGGIAANDFADYFKLNFLLQYFKRFEINIDEISQIAAKDDVNLIWSKSLKTHIENWTYTINFVGTFGSASVNFTNKGKRDQIYNYIRQLNKMGDPYVKAN